MEKTFTYPTQNEILALLVKLPFRSLTKDERATFAGCESYDPLISEMGEYLIVIDDDHVSVVHPEDMFGGVSYCVTP